MLKNVFNGPDCNIIIHVDLRLKFLSRLSKIIIILFHNNLVYLIYMNCERACSKEETNMI